MFEDRCQEEAPFEAPSVGFFGGVFWWFGLLVRVSEGSTSVSVPVTLVCPSLTLPVARSPVAQQSATVLAFRGT